MKLFCHSSHSFKFSAHRKMRNCCLPQARPNASIRVLHEGHQQSMRACTRSQQHNHIMRPNTRGQRIWTKTHAGVQTTQLPKLVLVLYELASRSRSSLLLIFSTIQNKHKNIDSRPAHQNPESNFQSISYPAPTHNMGFNLPLVLMMLVSIPAAFLVGTTLGSCNIILGLLALADVLVLYLTISTMSSLVIKRGKSNGGQDNRGPTNRRNSGGFGPGAARPQPRSTSARGVPSAPKRTKKSPTDVAQAQRVLDAIARTIASKTTGEELEFIMKKFEIMCKRVQSTAKAPELDSVLKANLLNEGIQFGLVQLKWFLS